MNNNKAIEVVVGIVVIIISISFALYAYKIKNFYTHSEGYNIYAIFQDVDGVRSGTDVKLSGIKIGAVSNLSIENDTYYSVVHLHIDYPIDIPKDSRALVSTSGILGDKYIRIVPGNSDDKLLPGEKIKFTQSSIILEDLIANLIYGKK